MAITAYTGPPGAGKSYALLSQVIIPAVTAGRTVKTNLEGVQPHAIAAYCAKSAKGQVGSVTTFEGSDALGPNFFPTKDMTDLGRQQAFIQPGDLVVFDEFKLTFPNRGPCPNPSLEPFLRWHRHLTDDNGTALDVVIATQVITDIHRDYRGLLERSYKFKKLSAVGAAKSYVYDIYEGSEQRKGKAFRTGHGRFKKHIFALYKSYDTDGEGDEKSTDGRSSILSGKFIAFAVLAVALVGYGLFKGYSFFTRDNTLVAVGDAPGGLPPPQLQATNTYARQPEASPFRIVGSVQGDGPGVVIVSDDMGTTRLEPARNFNFENGRPVSGIIDGRSVIAKDRLQVVTRPDQAF